jgi:AraC-like DNA-binding protein
VDVLSSILDILHFRSTLYCRVEIGAPWGLAFSPTPAATFHVVEQGRCWLHLDDEQRLILLNSGDLVMLSHGTGHRIGDAPETPAYVQIQLGQDDPPEPEMRCYTTEGETTALLCGVFALDQPGNYPFLALLPKLIHIRGEDGATAPWLDQTLRMLASEVTANRLGRTSLTRRLTDMLFIQIIRTWAEQQTDPAGGWLAALRNPQIGAALALMHTSPDHGWTVESLARAVHMSRAAFAARFTHLVGEPPLRYLRRWRMQKAIDLLKRSEFRIAEVAAAVGYDSEVSFSQVFKREIGLAPQRYRHNHS